MTDEQEKIDRLCQSIIRSLRAQNATAVIALSPELIGMSTQQPAVQAQAYGWLAQAYLIADRHEQAMKSITKGLTLSARFNDQVGLAALQQIRDKIDIKTPAPATITHDKSVLGSALAAIEREDYDNALIYARKAIMLADASQLIKEMVIARLTMAKIPDQTELALQQAQQLANDSGDHNLITAVKKASDEASFTIQPHVF